MDKLSCCPYCGSKEFYTKERYKGNTEFSYRFDGKEGDNSEYFDGAVTTFVSKDIYCFQCRHKLGKAKDYIKEE